MFILGTLIEQMHWFIGLEACLILRLFVPVCYWSQVKSSNITKPHMLCLYAGMFNAGQIN